MRWCDLALNRALELSHVHLFGASHVDSIAVSEQAVGLQYDFVLFRAADVVSLGLSHEETMLQLGFLSARRVRGVRDFEGHASQQSGGYTHSYAQQFDDQLIVGGLPLSIAIEVIDRGVGRERDRKKSSALQKAIDSVCPVTKELCRALKANNAIALRVLVFFIPQAQQFWVQTIGCARLNHVGCQWP